MKRECIEYLETLDAVEEAKNTWHGAKRTDQSVLRETAVVYLTIRDVLHVLWWVLRFRKLTSVQRAILYKKPKGYL